MKLPDQLRTFLEKPRFAVLATSSPSGGPQATPVWYLLEQDHILVNTSRGRIKLRNVQANPRVALAFVDQENPYRYVQIQGKVIKFDPEHGARDIDRLSVRYHGRAYRYPPSDAPEKRISLLIRPLRIDARGIS